MTKPAHGAACRILTGILAAIATTTATAAATPIIPIAATTITTTATAQTPAQMQPPAELALTSLASKPIDPPDYFELVPAKGVTDIQLSEPASRLVLAHGRSIPHVTLLPIDTKGKIIPDAKTASITLPDNALGEKHIDHVLSVATHPTLPVIYVWRDLASNPNQISPITDATRDYEHLFIYDISTDEPRLIFTGCKGEDYQARREAGTVNLSPDGLRLFMPNLTYRTKRTRGIAIGMYRLDDKGLPILKDADLENEDTQLNAPSAAEAEADADEAISSNRGGGLTMLTLNEISYRFPGQLALNIDKDHVIILSGNYLVGYNLASRASRMAAAFIPFSHPSYMDMSVHPQKPLAYLTAQHHSRVIAWAHFQGYPSMQPQVLVMQHQPVISKPIVMPARNQLAVGSTNAVAVIDLDESGWFTKQSQRYTIQNARVTLLTYSQKFDRLYVASLHQTEDKK